MNIPNWAYIKVGNIIFEAENLRMTPNNWRLSCEHTKFSGLCVDCIAFLNSKSSSELEKAIVLETNKRVKDYPEWSETQLVEPGVYELPTGEIYLVKFNLAKTRLYAKRLVEAPSERLTETGDRIKIDFVYENGAIYRIKPEHRMPLERAKELIIRYGRCIVCGHRLKVAESVERGIGPVCIKYFGTLR